MKKIEQYIQFAIDNGLFKRPKWYNWYYENKFHLTNYWEVAFRNTIIVIKSKLNKRDEYIYEEYNLIALITSGIFIEAIARGVTKEWLLNAEYDITTQQAIAIRDNKLPEFITNLWIWKQNT
jgi:hypothetical protein